MRSRTKAREIAFLFLFSKLKVSKSKEIAFENNQQEVSKIIQHIIQFHGTQLSVDNIHDIDIDFALTLIHRATENLQEHLYTLKKIILNWKLERISKTDLTLLIMACTELMDKQHFQTPHLVVINEAIRIGKIYGQKDSCQFINGILDKLLPFCDNADHASPPPV